MDETPQSQTPSLSNLPVDLAARCLEFSKFDEVHENAKQVSKALRSAARRALTRGRWRPIKQFAAASLSIKRTMDSPDAVPVASIEQYQAAWAADPSQVINELANWHGLSANIAEPIARFLAIVEPSIQGLGRIVAACEAPYHWWAWRTSGIDGGSLWDFILEWAADIGHGIGTWELDANSVYRMAWSPSLELVLIGDGLQPWDDVTFAAGFFGELFEGEGDYELRVKLFQGLSKHWRDRGKAAAFVACEEEEAAEVEREREEQWEAEHGWKYGPSGDKFWEEEDSDYDSVGLPYH